MRASTSAVSHQVMEARTLEIVAAAREVAERLAPPAPLRSSPKCPRCSLAGICLPDEHHVLTRART
jgi:CRISP-associated protein Cas1